MLLLEDRAAPRRARRAVQQGGRGAMEEQGWEVCALVGGGEGVVPLTLSLSVHSSSLPRAKSLIILI